jgi:putative SbcD/Mre11-related phosphoesterase
MDNAIAKGINAAKDIPGLIIKRHSALVIGDMHIGLENKLSIHGIHFSKSATRMGAEIKNACKKYNCSDIIFLGDIKESIGNPDKEEYAELNLFFNELSDYSIRIVKGNHDANISRVLNNINKNFAINNEILLGRYAFFHGNSWPSAEAMHADVIFCAHGHFAIERNSIKEKIFIDAKIGKGANRKYSNFNKKARLVMLPAFSNLISGTKISNVPPRGIPLLKNNVFNWSTADVFGINGKYYGKVNNIIQD